MKTSGYFVHKHNTGPDDAENEQVLSDYLMPYLETHINEITEMIRAAVVQRIHVYQSTPFERLQEQILRDVLEAIQRHMASKGIGQTMTHRGGGLGSFFSRFISWLLPKATKVFSLIPQEVKSAAAAAATDLAVTGIQTAAEKVKSRIEQRGGHSTSPFQYCCNEAVRAAIDGDNRGGFIGALASGLAMAVPALMSLFQGRGGGIGPFWKSAYPLLRERGGGRQHLVAVPVALKRKSSEPVPGPSRKVSTRCSRRGGASNSTDTLTVYSDSVSGTVQCFVTIPPGRKGGRPLQRTGYCFKAQLTDMK